MRAGAEYKGTVTTDSAGVAVLEAMREPYGHLFRLTLNEEQMDSLRNLILEEKIYEYKKSSKPDHRVLDGYSWTLGIQFENHPYIKRGGSNVGFGGEGIKKLRQMLQQLASNPNAVEIPCEGLVW